MTNNTPGGLPPLEAADLDLLKNYVAAQGLPAQVEAIVSDAPLTVVSAGAGTGKTWTLAWRFVWTALTRQDARNILTLTFTEKAAAEMRSRIAALLAGLEPALSASPELERRRAQAAVVLDQAYISTLHGFGARVIGEAGLNLPVEPSPGLMSDAEADEFWNELAGALDRLDAAWFAAGLDEDAAREAERLLNDPDTVQTINLLGAEGAARFARDFEGMMADLGGTPESVCAKAGDGAASAREALGRLLDDEYARLADMWSDALDIDPAGYGKTKLGERLAAFRGKWLERGFEGAADCRAFVAEAVDAVKGATGKLAGALAEALGMKVKDWRDRAIDLAPFARVLDSGFTPDELRLRAALIRLAALCWRRWNAFRDGSGRITFNDMIALSRRALALDPRYASRFAEVLVDEFQDTNETQDALLSAIRDASGARLFVVGDLKQSIYRFRHAEPALFEKYIREARDGGGRYIALSVSFRSGEGLLDAVNSRFSQIWKRSLGEGLNVPYEALESPRGLERAAAWIDERQNTGLPVCERLFEAPLPREEGEAAEKTGETRDRAALRLACRLSELRAQGASVWGGSALRPVAWRDMAVLVPTRTSYESLRRAFSIVGVPAAFSGSRSFYARTEIRDACAFVSCLAQPDDAAALAGFLCSPFSGLPQNRAQELLPAVIADPRGALAREEPELAARLRDLRLTARLRGASAALASLLARGDLLKNVHPRKRAGALANLRRAVLLLERWEQSFGASAEGAAAYLRRAMRADAADPEAGAEDGGDAVQVMTIHASKGLEFPLVAVFGLEHTGRKGGGGRAVPSRSLTAAASTFPDEWGAEGECLLGSVHKRLDERAEYEELQRLYYVALTRARDGLILSGLLPRGEYHVDKDSSMMSVEYAAGAFSPALDELDPLRIGACRRANAPAAGAQVVRGADVTVPRARPRSLAGVSATSFALWSMCPAAWRLSFRQQLDLSWNAADDASATGEVSAGGAGLGTVAHWLMAEWNLSDADYRRLLSLPDGRLKPEYRRVWRDPAAKAELAGFLNGFHTPAGEALLSRLRAAEEEGRLRREFPFRVPLGPGDLVGAVDAFWIDRDERGRDVRLCVRDYKTTRLPSDAARRGWLDAFYAAQLRFYALALRRLRPEYAALELDLALWNLRTGSEQALAPLSDDGERSLEEAVREQMTRAATGPWQPAHSHCAGCAYARGCVFRGEGQAAPVTG